MEQEARVSYTFVDQTVIITDFLLNLKVQRPGTLWPAPTICLTKPRNFFSCIKITIHVPLLKLYFNAMLFHFALLIIFVVPVHFILQLLLTLLLYMLCMHSLASQATPSFFNVARDAYIVYSESVLWHIVSLLLNY